MGAQTQLAGTSSQAAQRQLPGIQIHGTHCDTDSKTLLEVQLWPGVTKTEGWTIILTYKELTLTSDAILIMTVPTVPS